MNNKSAVIRESVENTTKLFVISFPRKSRKPVLLGIDILNNILKDNDVIIYIDTFLSFMDKTKAAETISKLKDELSNEGIKFEYKTVQTPSKTLGTLGKLFGFSKRIDNRETIVFAIKRHSYNENLFSKILDLGCEMYIPESLSDNIVQEISEGVYQNDEKKYSSFKYVIFISDYLGQAALRSKNLNLEDVQNLCIQSEE